MVDLAGEAGDVEIIIEFAMNVKRSLFLLHSDDVPAKLWLGHEVINKAAELLRREETAMEVKIESRNPTCHWGTS